MGAFVLSIPEHKLTVISPDVGGGFGSKIFHYAEEAIVTWVSNKIKNLLNGPQIEQKHLYQMLMEEIM